MGVDIEKKGLLGDQNCGTGQDGQGSWFGNVKGVWWPGEKMPIDQGL